MPLLQDTEKKSKGPRLYDDKYPSVTEVLSVIYKPHIEAWRKRVGHEVANQVSENATTLGTKVHNVCEKMSVGEDVTETDTRVLAVAAAYQGFLDEYVEKVILTEQILVSEKLGIGGTMDAYVELKGGKRAIIDIKTSKNFSPEMGLQMAGYQMMLEEKGYKVDERIIVRLSKDKPGKYYVKFFDDPQDRPGFIAARNLWFWRQRWDFRSLSAGDADALDPLVEDQGYPVVTA